MRGEKEKIKEGRRAKRMKKDQDNESLNIKEKADVRMKIWIVRGTERSGGDGQSKPFFFFILRVWK